MVSINNIHYTMFFLVDKKNKILFGWSAKCGCSHIKTIFNYLNNIVTDRVHEKTFNALPENIEEYTTILISRNPYKRLVSGFLDKYKKDGLSRKRWKHNVLTFTLFVNELIKNQYVMIDKHHFTPQTSESFDMKLLRSKSIKCYDIHAIDYNYIETLYNKKIPTTILNKRFGHEKDKTLALLNKFVYNLPIDSYTHHKINTQYFYNSDLIQKVYNFYKQDFLFFQRVGIHYYYPKQRSTI